MEIRVPTRLTASEGRRFAFPVGAAFAVLAGLTGWRGHMTFSVGFGALAAFLLLAGLVVPARLGPVYRGWMRMAVAISRVTTPIFMGILYFLVIMPVGFVRRVVGKNPLVHSPGNDGYWVARSTPRGDLKRQF